MALFDRFAPRYDSWYATAFGAKVDGLEKRALFALARPQRGENALDVGCGTGNYTLDLAARGLRCVGVDLSAGMLDVASAKCSRMSPRPDYVQASAVRLPFPDAQFDLVLCVTALEFVEGPEDAVAEMVRVLRPGGRLVVGVLNRWSTWALARRLGCGSPVFKSAHFLGPGELGELLAPYGAVAQASAVFFPHWTWLARGNLLDVVETRLAPFAGPFGAFLVARVEKLPGPPPVG